MPCAQHLWRIRKKQHTNVNNHPIIYSKGTIFVEEKQRGERHIDVGVSASTLPDSPKPQSHSCVPETYCRIHSHNHSTCHSNRKKYKAPALTTPTPAIAQTKKGGFKTREPGCVQSLIPAGTSLLKKGNREHFEILKVLLSGGCEVQRGIFGRLPSDWEDLRRCHVSR